MMASNWIRSLTLSVAAVALLAASVNAQPNRTRGNSRMGGPDVGAPLPDVTLYDENGEPVQLASLKGSYSVLVFGCLT